MVSSGRNAATGALLLACAAGCASIVSGRNSQVHVDSHPRHAQVTIRDDKGAEVASARTPAVVTLKRGRSWLRPAHYTAVVSKPGYETVHAPIRSTLNPWILGNVAAGGVVGLAVDGATGAGWKPKPGELTVNLEPLGPAPPPDLDLASAEEDADPGDPSDNAVMR